MGKSSKQTRDEIYRYIILAIGIIAIVFIVAIIIRIQRGLLGFILSGVAVLLLAYWLREILRTIRKEMSPPFASTQKTWVYDIIDSRDSITFVAEVPGPENQVRVELIERTLKIRGGQEFVKEVMLPEASDIVESHYVNGVLNVRLKKVM
jgi:HSP20 family protein